MTNTEKTITMEESIMLRGTEIQEKQGLMHTLVSELKQSRDYIAWVEKIIEKAEVDEDKDITMEELEEINFKKRMLAATKARVEEILPQVEYAKEEFFKLFNV